MLVLIQAEAQGYQESYLQICGQLRLSNHQHVLLRGDALTEATTLVKKPVNRVIICDTWGGFMQYEYGSILVESDLE